MLANWIPMPTGFSPTHLLSSSLRRLFLAAATLVVGFSSPARAANFIWVGPSPYLYPYEQNPTWDDNSGNWSELYSPTDGDTAIFPKKFTPVWMDSFYGLRRDGSEVLLGGGWSGPMTGNLVFLNNWKLTQ